MDHIATLFLDHIVHGNAAIAILEAVTLFGSHSNFLRSYSSFGNSTIAILEAEGWKIANLEKKRGGTQLIPRARC